ncbi:MAG: 2-amino-4-hydroxy-6-hydroxymethyldihydropteridine diphosphokinase, partial [Pseudomonadales bacterium]|nr:2-amino-4-hydroxy-6-hydroxymethyldihydropteridine diphosphokinase [Pseudomonadales bacterium]
MPLVAVSVGSNLDREHNIDWALESLRSSFGPLRVSRVYETPAVGFSGPDFYNLVVVFETGLDVRLLIGR